MGRTLSRLQQKVTVKRPCPSAYRLPAQYTSPPGNQVLPLERPPLASSSRELLRIKKKKKSLHVRILRTGLLAMPLRLPALISVNKFSEKGGLLGVACDEFVLQELLGSGSLPGRQTKSELNSTLTKTQGRIGKDVKAGPCPTKLPSSLHTLPQSPQLPGVAQVGIGLTNRGSLLRQASTNSLKGLLWWPSNVGGLFLGIRNRTRIGWRSEFGGSPLASSMAVMPRDQMSA